jgi:3-deoxy-D-manno-octulosonic-acid transferase
MAADTFLKETRAKILVNDDLQTISFYFKQINPCCIVMMGQEVLVNLLFFALLKNIPIYLLDAAFSNQTQRNLITNPFLYTPLFNLFKRIFVNDKKEIELFKGFGISTPVIHYLGDINSFNMLEKKAFYLEKFKIDEDKIRALFPYPVLLVNPLNKNHLDFYLNVFQEVKDRYPTVKMIITPESLLPWTYTRIDKIKNLGYSVFLWDESTHLLNHAENIFLAFKPICDNHDIILTSVRKDIFFLQAIASMYLVDGNLTEVKNQNFMEAATWKNPIIIGPINEYPTAHSSFLDTHEQSEIAKAIVREIPLIKGQSEEEIIEMVMMLLEDKELAEATGEHAFHGLKKLSYEISINIEPLFTDIKKFLLKE